MLCFIIFHTHNRDSIQFYSDPIQTFFINKRHVIKSVFNQMHELECVYRKETKKKFKHNPVGFEQMFKFSSCQNLSSLLLHEINILSFLSYITPVYYLFSLKTQGRRHTLKGEEGEHALIKGLYHWK